MDKIRDRAEKADKNMIIVVSSPSGGGKTTIVDGVLRKMEGIERTISYTTRKPRGREENNKDYVFVSEEQFIKMINEGDILEWEKNFDKYYGTSVQQVKDILTKGKDVILNIDVRGAQNIKKKFPESITVFIMPPSLDELKKRLEKRRTEKPEQIEARLREAEREIKCAGDYDHIVVNNDLETAIDELITIILERKKA